MAGQFDSPTLGILRDAREVRIRTRERPGHGIIIWIVVVDGEVFVRSVRGARGRWYEAAANVGRAVLEAGDCQLDIHLMRVTDAAIIASVSEAYLMKYAASSYAKEMVRAETLPTTLRVEPAYDTGSGRGV